MKVSVYCVNYNSYDSLKNYLVSLDVAMEKTGEKMALSVFVADNSTQYLPVDYQPKMFSLQVVQTGGNKGYFGAVHLLMEKYSPLDFDYSIVSNVDVLLSDDFFCRLAQWGNDGQTGWIAPQIFSSLEQRDRNPKIMHRYSKRKLQILKIKFRFPLLNWVYNNTVYKSKKLVRHEPGEIYAGHGSFIILTKAYFEQCGIIVYPVFLFCEEIYLAEQCQQHQLKVVYDPSLRVNDAEHASTGTFRRSRYCRYNVDAISYILKMYYAPEH